MEAGATIAEILKREGVEIIFGYPVNHILEFAARAGIRPIIVRQERIGLHMADAFSRLTSGEKIGVFAMQHGPGAENAYGGVAQAYGDAVPILVLPMGYPRRIAHVQPNFCSFIQMRGVTKSAEPVTTAAEIPNILRRAFRRRAAAVARRRWSRCRSTCSPRRSASSTTGRAGRCASAPILMRCARRQGAWSRPSGR